MLRFILLSAVAFATPALAAPRETPEARLDKMLAGHVAGKPVNCIALTRSRSSTIIDGIAIVYHSGARMYVNRPRSGADRLNDNVILVNRSIGSQLCSVDTLDLIDRGSQIQRGFVILGDFVPYDPVKTRR